MTTLERIRAARAAKLAPTIEVVTAPEAEVVFTTVEPTPPAKPKPPRKPRVKKEV